MAESVGKVVNVLPVETVGQSNHKKQTFVIETDGAYPKKVAFDVWNDKIQYIKPVGSFVTVSYEPESRESNGRYYTTLKAFAIK